jgi:predicted dehydrogenase
MQYAIKVLTNNILNTKKLSVMNNKTENKFNRRDFITKTATGAIALTIVPRFVLGGSGYRAPSDIPNVAVIGCGSQGKADVTQLCDPVNPIADQDMPNFIMGMMAAWGSAPPAMSGSAGKDPIKLANIYALCDVDKNYAGRVFKGYPKAKVYSDYRIMLEESKEIDAVVIATPDHLHAVIAAHAMKMKKHVYCEKPMTKTITELRELMRIAKESGVVTQMGNQGHAAEGTRQTVEWIRSGVIGDVKEVWLSTDRPVWAQGFQNRPSSEAIPAGLDYDLWLGPAPNKPYSSKIIPFGWRGLWDYGTGALGDMGAHIFDAPIWALDLDFPAKISASTSPFTEDYMPNAQHITYEFGARNNMPPVTVHWTDGGILPSRPKGLKDGQAVLSAVYIGEKGIIMHDTHGAKPILVGQDDFKGVDPWLPRTKNIFEDWIDAIKNGTKACNDFVNVSGKLTEILLLGNIAVKTKAKNTVLNYDAKNMRITNLEEANKFFHYEYRKGWSL